MRVIKEHDERRKEIIQAASTLFAQKGYEKCSVADILKAVGIAKGTFYYYFKSKEEVLDAAVEEISKQVSLEVQRIAAQKEISVIDRFIQVLLATKISDPTQEVLIEEMHKTNNALLHQKTLVSIMRMLTPILSEMIEEGNEAEIFRCPYPEQSVQILLSAALTLLDDGIFQMDPSQKKKIFEGLIFALEKMLGVKRKTFEERMWGQWRL